MREIWPEVAPVGEVGERCRGSVPSFVFMSLSGQRAGANAGPVSFTADGWGWLQHQAHLELRREIDTQRYV